MVADGPTRRSHSLRSSASWWMSSVRQAGPPPGRKSKRHSGRSKDRAASSRRVKPSWRPESP